MAATDWNQHIIEEFRANEGNVGGRFEGHPLLLLHHRGARTGAERVNPLAYQALSDGAVAIFGSRGGSSRNPDWYYNVRANPEVTVEVGTETFRARARVAEGEERARIWERQKREVPGFAEYERRTTRQIPVVILERVITAEGGGPEDLSSGFWTL
ncbi:MAG: nitroreductase family deazaflavin-dependent oxidoreductase [Actinomycetota bacterium]|nr:nitroreductase family deazaflavin-dependent oxidoreductase [Actinomycetota bacterium]